MKNVYLYGASDDCMELESDFGNCESYEGIEINNVRVHYTFDGDWGVWLEGKIPASWKIKSIRANCASDARDKKHGGQFIHIQVPDDEQIKIKEIRTDED